MNTKFGILARLALVTFIGVFTAVLALGVIFPLGVQGADHPIADNGQAVDFLPTMVTDVLVTNTNQGPGEVSGFRFQFTTPHALTANEDAITVHFDKDFRDLPEVLSRSNITLSAYKMGGGAITLAGSPANTGAYSPASDPSREILNRGKHGLSNSVAMNNVEYTFYVPDMNGNDDDTPGIAAGATVTVIVSPAAGIGNPTEAGNKGPIGVFTNKKPTMDTTKTVPVALVIALSDYDSNRNKDLTVIGRGFKNGTKATVYLDRSRDTDGTIINVPDGMHDPVIDTVLESRTVDSDDTFFVHFTVTVPPFAPEGVNQINAIDGDNPPNHYNGMGGQTAVTFTIEPLLTISPSAVSIGDEIEISLVDWPATDQVMDQVTPDAQGVDRVKQSAVTIAGIPQEITSGEGAIGSDNEHTFLVRVGTAVPVGIQELRVKTYTTDQVMSDVPRGASDTKKITITDRCFPGDVSPDPGGVAGDRSALVALYNATDGVNWTNNANWLTDAPLGEWYGVSTYAGGRVCTLNLQGNGLSGKIPEELGNLTNLTVLYLENNQLSGEIPPELGSLSNLDGLYLSYNQLSGAIPPTLGELTNLTELHLYANQLSGAIPPELGGLTNLTGLYLNDNELSGEIPEGLGRLTNLTELHLYANQLSGEMPAELGTLSSLGALFLSHNRLSGEIPPELARLSNLQGLYLWGNQLTGMIPEELGSLTNLKVLYLDNNQLTGEIPPELGNLANLAWLHLENNQLSGEIPPELGNLTNLKVLSLLGNQLTGKIPPELGNLTALNALYLYDNQLTGVIPEELGSLTNLKVLYLNNNQLSGEIPPGLGSLSNLDGLYFEKNQLSGEIPPELGNLTSLTALSLSHNQLTGEIPPELGNIAGLVILSLGSNRLSGEILAELGSLTNLEGLHLNGNRLTGCIPASLRGVVSHDLAELGLPFCDMLDGRPVVVVGFVSEAGAPVRLGSPVSLEATFSEPVSGFSLEDINVANGVASNFSGGGSVYTFDVTPNAIGDVTIDITAGAAQDAGGNGSIAARLSFGIPYDDDGDGAINKSEVIAAIIDYLFEDGSIAKSHLIDLINLYLSGGTP